MKTLADFKRELKAHKGYWRFTWQCGSESRSGLRKVVRVQANSVAMWREGGASLEAAIANPHGSATWLDFPKARHCLFQGDKIIIRPEPGFSADPSEDGTENALVMTYEKLPNQEGGEQ